MNNWSIHRKEHLGVGGRGLDALPARGHFAAMNRGAVAQQIGMLLVAFLFIYVAAVGPVEAHFRVTHTRPDSTAVRAVSVIYFPVIVVCRTFPPVEKVLGEYCDFCEERYQQWHRPADV